MDHRPLIRQHPLDRTTTDDAIIDNSNITTTPLSQANPSHFIPYASTQIPQDFTSKNNFIAPGQTLKHGLQSAIPRSLNNINQNSWQNGLNGGSLDQAGMRFYDSNIQPTISIAPNIGTIGTDNNNHAPLCNAILPSQPTPLIYQSSNINSTPLIEPSSHLLPINPTDILPLANSATVTQNSPFNHQTTHTPLSQTTQFRQLPSMSTLIGNNIGSNSHISRISMEQNIDPVPTNASSQIPTYRRSLPPMTHITGANNQLYNTNTQRNSIKGYSHHSNYPLPNDSALKQLGNTTMRQLPIITPYGPKPIHRPSHRPPLRDINQTPPQLRTQPQPRPTITIQPSSINHVSHGNDLAYTTPSTTERTSAQDIGQNSENNYPAEFEPHRQLSPLSARAQTSPNNRLNTQQTTNNTSQRQLPIITRQGVLRLRDNSSFVDNENNLPQARKRLSKPYNAQNAIISSSHIDKVNKKFDKTIQDVCIDSKQRRLSNLTDSDNDYYDEDNYEQQEQDLDTGEDDRVSDDSIVESEEIVSSVKSEKEIEEGIDHGEMVDEHNEVTMPDQDQQENINIYVNGDEFLSEDETYFNESKVIEEVDEEAEYFSALATVPEEEGKLSDKDNLDYDQQFEEGDEPSLRDQEDSSVKSNEISTGTNNKLPTIVENGFEAQVLEYIVEKTGMRRGELFSVDEEPSSYNEDADSGSMESKADNGRQESLDISDNYRLPMINDEPCRAKNDNNVEVNFNNHKIGQNDDSEPKSLQNDSIIQDSVGDFTVGSEESKFNRYTQQQFDLNRDSSISDGKKADFGDCDDTKQNLLGLNRASLSVTNFDTCETNHSNQDMKNNRSIDNLNTEFISIQDHDGRTMIGGSNEQQLYVDQKISDYDLVEEEEEDERILMSPNNNKTSFEQEEYDEQYRDINNLDDLDRRATNHVHAIDGHSKSMLNDIHQQRTIVDYYDENDFPVNNNNSNYNSTDNHLEPQGAYDNRQEDVNRETYPKQDFQDHQIERNDYLNDALERDHKDQEKQAEKEEDEVDVEDDFDPSLPRARVRWITAVNKIVNRFGEVSYILETRLEFRSVRQVENLLSLIGCLNLHVSDSFLLFSPKQVKV